MKKNLINQIANVIELKDMQEYLVQWPSTKIPEINSAVMTWDVNLGNFYNCYTCLYFSNCEKVYELPQ